jgi:outer membrane protein TolC
LSEDQRNAGSIDVTTSLNVQRTLFEAQDALVQIRLVRLQAIVSLYQALGGGWRADPLPQLTNKPFETLPATAIDPPVPELQE